VDKKAGKDRLPALKTFCKILICFIDGFVKSDLLRWRTIFAENNSEKRPHCHFER